MAHPKQTYIYCDQCRHCIRTDDGSYCRHYLTRARTHNVESSMVVFRSPDGKVSIPWEPNAPCPAGYVREEVRGARAVRKLERELDARDLRRHQQHMAKREFVFGPQRQKRREDLKQIVRDGSYTVTDRDGRTHTKHVTQVGRDLARAALSRLDSGYSKSYDPGNYRRD